MQPRTFCFVTVFLGCAAFASFALATPVAVTEGTTSEEQKVLLDCQHTDYRTYIKCLKRQKRHHLQHGESHGNFASDCWETCLKKCDTEPDCDKKCGHCLKKTKHKHQIITEYETECTSDDCANKDNKEDRNDFLRSTNITTKIDIHNIIGNGSGMCCPTCQPPVPCSSTPPSPQPPQPQPPQSNLPYPQPPQPYPPRPACQYPPHQPYPPYPSNLPFSPQLVLMPQLSLGLGLSLGGGCSYANQWPCIPAYDQSGQTIDCSGCRPPYNHFKCDVACYAVHGTYPHNSGSVTSTNSPTPCTSPHCVGGSQG